MLTRRNNLHFMLLLSVSRTANLKLISHWMIFGSNWKNWRGLKTQKKKAASSSSNSGSSCPANKRIRASNGGPASPAMAGCLTERDGVYSPLITSASPSHASHGASSPYSYNSHEGHTVYCAQAVPVLREPCVYPPDVSNVGLGMAYPSPPMTFPAYSGYNSRLGCYNNAVTPIFHQVYY
jgi:hypothetical protein